MRKSLLLTSCCTAVVCSAVTLEGSCRVVESESGVAHVHVVVRDGTVDV